MLCKIVLCKPPFSKTKQTNKNTDWLDAAWKWCGSQTDGILAGKTYFCPNSPHLSEGSTPIPYPRLGEKIFFSNIDKTCIFKIKCIHKVLIREWCTCSRYLTPCVIAKRVKQGWILTHVLYNLYIKDIIEDMIYPMFHVPQLTTKSNPMLLYSASAILQSQSKMGLRRLPRAFSDHGPKEHLMEIIIRQK